MRVTEERANEIRDEFQGLLGEVISERQIQGPIPQSVFVQSYLAGDRLYVHLINYDYELTTDTVNPAQGLSLQVRCPSDFVPSNIKLISPDLGQTVELEFSMDNGYVSFEVPELLFWDVVIMER